MQSAPASKAHLAFLFLLVCSLAAVGSVSAQQKSASRTGPSRTGWISDESCGAQHTKSGRADCVQKCWRGGASVGHPEWKPQRAVFIPDVDHAVWIVDNPQAVADFPAAHVLLAGNFDSAKKTLHVEKITPASP
jgi:hypothetical protein